MSKSSSKGYQFTIQNGLVTQVFEIKNGRVKEKGIDPRRIRPEGKGESEPANWIDEKGKEVVLTEDYINQFKTTDKAKFERLHQINRRTTANITSDNFDPATTTLVADPKYLQFITPLPK